MILPKGVNAMKQHTLAVYGDSISLDDYEGGGWPRKIQSLLDFEKVYNHAIGASGLSASTPNNTVRLLDDPKNLHSDADLVIIWHGTNDWYWGAPVGNAADTGEDTFAGAMHAAVRKLRQVNPEVKIIWMTPIFRHQPPDQSDSTAEAWESKNKAGFTMKDYDGMIWEQSNRLTFPVIDLRRLTNFSMENKHIYYRDIAHPSEPGFERIADLIARHLKQWYW